MGFFYCARHGSMRLNVLTLHPWDECWLSHLQKQNTLFVSDFGYLEQNFSNFYWERRWVFLPRSIPKDQPRVGSWHRNIFCEFISMVKPTHDWNQILYQNTEAVSWIRYLLALRPVNAVHKISGDLEEGGGSCPNTCFSCVVPESE